MNSTRHKPQPEDRSVPRRRYRIFKYVEVFETSNNKRFLPFPMGIQRLYRMHTINTIDICNRCDFWCRFKILLFLRKVNECKRGLWMEKIAIIDLIRSFENGVKKISYRLGRTIVSDKLRRSVRFFSRNVLRNIYFFILRIAYYYIT